MLPLTGYADRFSVAPGETIAFKVSSTAAGPYHARLVRLISGDPNPAGPGIVEEPVDAPFAGSYPSRVQPVPLGSYLRVPAAAGLQGLTSFRALAAIWPATPAAGRRRRAGRARGAWRPRARRRGRASRSRWRPGGRARWPALAAAAGPSSRAVSPFSGGRGSACGRATTRRRARWPSASLR